MKEKDRVIITDPNRLEEALRQAKFQLEIEGFTLTDEDEQDVRAVMTGKMTREELIEKLKRGE